MASIFDLFKQIEKEKAPSAGAVEYIIAGLGNPGDKYANTRHNVGFLFLDYLKDKIGGDMWQVKFSSFAATARIGDKKVLLLKPQTFMNLSGKAVGEAAAFYKLSPDRVIVVCDDINFDCGKVRIRKSGSHGGHNGLRNIIDCLSSDAFPRIRVGAGKLPHPEYDLADFVLSRFTEEEKKGLSFAFGNTEKALPLIMSGEIEKAMSAFNGAKL